MKNSLKKEKGFIMVVMNPFLYKFGNDLLSHTVTHAVPSALKSLTAVFGMGTGGPSSLWSPKKMCAIISSASIELLELRTTRWAYRSFRD